MFVTLKRISNAVKVCTMSLPGSESKKNAGDFKYYTDINISGDPKLRLKKELAVGRWIAYICTASNSG